MPSRRPKPPASWFRFFGGICATQIRIHSGVGNPIARVRTVPLTRLDPASLKIVVFRRAEIIGVVHFPFVGPIRFAALSDDIFIHSTVLQILLPQLDIASLCDPYTESIVSPEVCIGNSVVHLLN